MPNVGAAAVQHACAMRSARESTPPTSTGGAAARTDVVRADNLATIPYDLVSSSPTIMSRKTPRRTDLGRHRREQHLLGCGGTGVVVVAVAMLALALDYHSLQAAAYFIIPQELTYCGSNEHVIDGTCEPCPAGTVAGVANPHLWSGADPSGPDTECEAITCTADFKVTSNECVSCLDGQTNTAGDDASGRDTQCDGCSPGFYRNPSDESALTYECIPCPAGYFCTGGRTPTLATCPAGT